MNPALSCADKGASARSRRWSGAPEPCASDEGCPHGHCRSALCSPGEVRCGLDGAARAGRLRAQLVAASGLRHG